jgi:DNA-binding PadR family transcriptional regulator
MRTNPQRTLTPLALAVLDLLHERDLHPYEMQQLIRDRGTDLVIKVRAGSLYHTIERLHRLDLIEAVQTGRDGRRPERTVYAITDIGRDEFRTNLRGLITYPEYEFPVFGAAVEMLRALEPADAADLLGRRTVALEARLAANDQVIASLTKRGLARLHLIELEYAQALCLAELHWVRDLIDDIVGGALRWPRRTPYSGLSPAKPAQADQPGPSTTDDASPSTVSVSASR